MATLCLSPHQRVEGMSQGMHLLEPQHFAVPFLAHALGSFVGALVACFAVASHRQRAVYFVGVFYLLGGITAATMIPAPAWFVVLDLVLAYIPMAWLAMKAAPIDISLRPDAILQPVFP